MHFRTSVKLTLLLAALALVFSALGRWQLERRAEKQDLFERFQNAPLIGLEEALGRDGDFARVRLSGRYDPVRHILVDNRIWQGRAGVHVLTPFDLDDGGTILVNRGWLPMAPDRQSLPDIPTDTAPRTISGMLIEPVSGGQRLGEPDVFENGTWPWLVTWFDMDAGATALGPDLAPRVLQLDATDDSGFGDRAWRAAVMEPEVHGAYALQWFALGAAAVVIWIVLGVRAGARTVVNKQPTERNP